MNGFVLDLLLTLLWLSFLQLLFPESNFNNKTSSEIQNETIFRSVNS